MLEIVPQNSEEWTLVKEMHLQKYPDHERDEMSIKRQFTKMHRKKQPTGDPHMRDHIRIAKKAFHEIGSCALISDGTNNFEVLEIPVIERTQTQTLEPTFEPTLGQSTQSTQLTDVQPSFDDSDEEEDLEAGDVPPAVSGRNTGVNTTAVSGTNTGVNTTAIVHRPNPPSRGRRNNNSTMQESVVQIMMMDMQQRQQEQQQRQQEHQDRMEQMERERIESRLLMSQAIDSMAKAFAIYQNNNSN